MPRMLELMRGIANDAFVYIMPYVNSKDSGVTIRSEKERVIETYSYNSDIEVKGEIIWQLFEAKKKLMTIEKMRQLKKKNQELKENGTSEQLKSGYVFGQMNRTVDYIDMINPSNIKKEDPKLAKNFREVASALKSKPIRSLRDFCKRKYGTLPTLMGVHVGRTSLENCPGAMSFIMSLEPSESSLSESFVFSGGDQVVFRGTDGYKFNIIQLTSSYTMDELSPTKQIKGNFLVEVDSELGDGVLFFADPIWKGGTQMFKDVLKEDGAIVCVEMELTTINSIVGQYYKMESSVYQDLEELSMQTESNMQCAVREHAEKAEEHDEDLDDSESDNEFEIQDVNLNWRERRGRGNRLPVLIS